MSLNHEYNKIRRKKNTENSYISETLDDSIRKKLDQSGKKWLHR